MHIRKSGGMTEFIPSPRERKDNLIRDHVFDLLENLHQRLEKVEQALALPQEEARTCSKHLHQIKQTLTG